MNRKLFPYLVHKPADIYNYSYNMYASNSIVKLASVDKRKSYLDLLDL
jgi:hypothetical protein